MAISKDSANALRKEIQALKTEKEKIEKDLTIAQDNFKVVKARRDELQAQVAMIDAKINSIKTDIGGA